ncbi:hypothetical protein FQN49_002293 [Arthroderma sp. PD_2]|nr:hypothetical protein FQN49_002293 [Arthroderma sp. PD_2]
MRQRIVRLLDALHNGANFYLQEILMASSKTSNQRGLDSSFQRLLVQQKSNDEELSNSSKPFQVASRACGSSRS